MNAGFRAIGIPQPKGSIQMFRTRRGKAILTSTTRELKPWASNIALSALNAGVTVVEKGPVRVHVEFVLPRPRSTRKSTVWQACRPDLDKLLRAVLDALTNVAWRDDGQVSIVQAVKRYTRSGEPPGATVSIVAL